MEDKNCSILFDYLRNTLYGDESPSLDPAVLDEPYQKLGRGLVFLNQSIQEMKAYSAALSTGNLSVQPPPRENPLCENLKNIHANLNHLTWQAKQVAKGDYSQTVSYLGEFSEAFNSMTAQLREREQTLRQEALLEKNHADMVDEYNKMLLNLLRHSREDILVTSIQQPRILYASSNELSAAQNKALFEIFLHKQENHERKESDSDAPLNWNWEAEDAEQRFYRITTSLMEWEGEPAYGHIVVEITQEKREHGILEQEAYFDKLTQIGNRLYFFKQIPPLLESGCSLAICFCDLDHLKFVNDTFGHAEGDRYLCSFVDLVRSSIREYDVFARMGGDEFCLVLPNCPEAVAESKMQSIQSAFAALPPSSTGAYERCFSFGIAMAEKDHGEMTIDSLLQQADRAMYDQKRRHKAER